MLPWVFVLVKWLHVAAASIWLGGLVFTVIMNRALRALLAPQQAAQVTSYVGRRMQRPLRYSLYVAILAGLGNVLLRFNGLSPLLALSFYSTPFGQLFLLKLLVTLALLAVVEYHSRAARRLAWPPNGPVPPSYRRRLIAAGWAALLLTLLLALLGSLLRFS